MNELLNNVQVQTALITLIVLALNALAQWIKSKTRGSLLEYVWCYAQPIIATFIAAAREVMQEGGEGSAAIRNIMDKSLVEFADNFELFEGRPPTEAEIAAVRNELVAQLKRIIGKGEDAKS